MERAYLAAEIKKPVAPFTCFWGRSKGIGSEIQMVLTPPMDIPYFNDHVASQAAWELLDIQDPEEWKGTFPAYICWDLRNQEYVIVGHNHIDDEDIIDFTPKHDMTDSAMHSYRPFDMASGQLRGLSALFVLASKMARKPIDKVWWPKEPPSHK